MFRIHHECMWLEVAHIAHTFAFALLSSAQLSLASATYHSNGYLLARNWFDVFKLLFIDLKNTKNSHICVFVYGSHSYTFPPYLFGNFRKKTNLNFHFIFGELRRYLKLYTIFYLAVDVKHTKFIQSLVHSCATHKKQLGYIGDRRSKRIRQFRCMAEIKLDHISLVVISCVLFFYCLFDNWIFRCLD